MADRYSESERFGRRFRDQDDRYREQWQGGGPRHHDEGAYGYTEREQGRSRGERDDRGFFDRAGDEVRSWFGDDEAQRRRMRDEAEYGGREGYGRPRSGDWWQGRRPESRGDDRRWGGYGGGYSREEADRDWARQWGNIDRGPQQQRSGEWGDPERYGGSSWTSRGGYGGEGYGRRSGGQSSGYDMWAPWAMGGGPHAGRGPRGYQRSDERIKEDICERMSQHGQLDASDLEVRVVNAEVTIEGTVNDRQAKRLAEDIAEAVMGVREVHNQVRVTQGMYGQQGQAGQQSTQGRQGEQRNRAA
jgi:osmotically-inducible protein OsmY